MNKTVERRIGLEQEFFLVDRDGVLSDRADEFLRQCHAIAQAESRDSKYFAPEFVRSIVELNTPPAWSLKELAQEYLENLKLALRAAHALDLRLYPLSQYPLHIMPVIRDEPNYHIQARTVGYDRFLNAGRCVGTHLHLDLPPGTIDTRVGVSYTATAEAREELLNLYNLATALDPALIAMASASLFYEGRVLEMAARTVHYRGSEAFGWEGVYTHLPEVGGLRPYAASIEHLVEMQFERYYTWLAAMDRAGVERHLFLNAGGSLLRSGWNPVRLNRQGTVELRATDGDFPEVTLAIATLVYNAADRVRREGWTVRPAEGSRVFQTVDHQLVIPDFAYLNGDLFYAAVTEGMKNADVKAYLDSVLAFAAQGGEGADYLTKLRSSLDHYQTTEAKLLKEFAPTTSEISREDGLRLVRWACDRLEEQIELLSRQDPLTILSQL
ncbi:glutamate-cysteine ligase family protein [Myxacorys almedinensis]|uniref:Glutamate--cysteine ligase n=1 Tax=Myxacorys almedinensis A TaxID=2690445 RepID=A0A8J7ZAN4_9CYAN|nr:glutamate-cysteine ligase family protein [Myxacorys almedinensis]NDJ19438.1 glutamate--cysteine ligase [Myxacorys almedinensis A]